MRVTIQLVIDLQERKGENSVPVTPLIPQQGGVVAQSVEHATPGEEVPGLIPAVAASFLLVGSVSV